QDRCISTLVPKTPEHSRVLKAKIELAAGPGVGGGVADLLLRKARRGPVRGLGALGNPETEKQSGQVAHARLGEAVALRHLSEVEHRGGVEREQTFQLAEIVVEA